MLRQKSSQNCVLYRRLGPRCAGAATSRAFFNRFRTGLSVACSMLSSVKPGKSPLKRSLSHLFINFSGSLLLQDRVAVHLEDVVVTTNAKASDSECHASSGFCRDLGHIMHVTKCPLRRCCTQVIHEVNDFRFLWVSICSNFRDGVVEFMQVGRH